MTPDRQKIAIVGHDKIELAMVDGSNRRTLFSFPEINLFDEVYLPEVYWHRNSESFAVVLPSQHTEKPLFGQAEIWEFGTDGSASLRAEIDWPFWEEHFLSFASDLTKFSFMSAINPETDVVEITVCTIPMKECQVVFTGPVHTDYWLLKNIQWAPDGNHIFILSTEGENNLSIVNIGGNEEVVSLTEGIR